jgi:imidazolonepropionase-like amidohydrolase
VIAAGVDVVSHVCYLPYQFAAVKPQNYASQTAIDPAPYMKGDHAGMSALYREMKERHIILDATVQIYFSGAATRPGEKPNCPPELAIKLTQQAYREGVQISAGTDGPDTPWQDGYPALYGEIEVLAKRVGMSNRDVIRSATQIAAKALGHGDEMGTIVPGKLANLVFVQRDPLADISNLRTVSFTVKRGTIYSRSDYVPLTAKDVR